MQVTLSSGRRLDGLLVGDPPYVPVVTAAWLVPGLAVRPGRSGLADATPEERTGLALLELMLVG